jgi:formylglycine-generating enzyme required for sulfatase activity
LIAVIIGLVGWINQVAIVDQWRFLTVTWPYERANVWPYVLSVAKEQALKPDYSFRECVQDCPEMIVVPAGSFTMGSPRTEKGRWANEGPQHSVTIAAPFAVSKNEVTFADWDACVAGGGCDGYKPSDQGWGRGQQPVININWEDAQHYVAWFSRVTGRNYRLLTQSEYEYAARAGTTTAYPWGDDIKLNGTAMANCNGCGSKWDNRQTAPVGSFAPNNFGLYDMVGNVWAWTEDCVHESYDGAPADGSAWLKPNGSNCSEHFATGGSWNSAATNVRSAIHFRVGAVNRLDNAGLRIARTLLAP